MEYNERNITAVEVFKKLEEVEKQNKEILEKLENMQESNAIFHHGFATIFEALRGLNEVKQDETANQSKGEKEETVVVKRVSEEKADDFINFLNSLTFSKC